MSPIETVKLKYSCCCDLNNIKSSETINIINDISMIHTNKLYSRYEIKKKDEFILAEIIFFQINETLIF